MAISYVRYNGTGAQTNFSITFPYLERDHLEVRVDNVEVSFSWVNATTVAISPAPANGTIVELRRRTPSDTPIADFQDGAIVTEEQLDQNAKQSLFVSQESEGRSDAALALAQQAAALAEAASAYNLSVTIEAFGAVGDGVADDSDAFDAAIAYVQGGGGGRIGLRRGATYKVTREFTLNNVQIYGDRTQTIVQHTANRGVFIAQSKAAVRSVNFEYREGGVVNARTTPSGMYKGLSAFQRISAVWAEGSNVTIEDIFTKNFFTSVALRGPVVTAQYPISGITLGTPTTLTSTAHGIPVAGRGYLTGVVGPTALNDVTAQVITTGANTVTIAINSTGFPAYVSGGVLNLYDFTAQSTDLKIVGVYADRQDFVITGSQYNDGLIETIRLTNQTNLTVPPHVIYLQNAGTGPTAEEGYVEKIIFRDIKWTGATITSQPVFKVSNAKNCSLETFECHGAWGGVLWSKAYNCKTISPNITDLPNSGIGINFTDTGADCEVTGGLIACANGQLGYGVLTEQTVARVVVDGTKFRTDVVSSDQTSRGFRTQDSSSMVCLNVMGEHLQAGSTFYLCGTSGTSTLEAHVLRNKGNTRVYRAAAGSSGKVFVNPRALDAWTLSNNTCVRNDGATSFVIDAVGNELVWDLVTSPSLFGTSTPGTNTYSGSTRMRHRRVGGLVISHITLELTAKDGALAGNINVGTLPWTVAGDTTSPGARAEAICSDASGMASYPAGNVPLIAEAVPAQTYARLWVPVSTSAGVGKTLLHSSNITNTTAISFVLVWRTDDPI